MRKILAVFSSLLLVPVAHGAEQAAAERIDLIQRHEVVVEHQRLVGIVRAQARREGVIVNLPQLFVFLSDYAAAYHVDTIRRGFERELNLIIDRQRRARSMVRLDRLLERVTDTEGNAVTIADLPPGDVYLLIYRRDGCEECDALAEHLAAWLTERDDLSAVWIDVWMDRRPE